MDVDDDSYRFTDLVRMCFIRDVVHSRKHKKYHRRKHTYKISSQEMSKISPHETDKVHSMRRTNI